MVKYNKEFKEEALMLSDEIGIKEPRSSLGCLTTRLLTGASCEKELNRTAYQIVRK